MYRRWNGSAWIDIESLKRWGGTSWIDVESVKRFDGSSWIDVYTNKLKAMFKDMGSIPSTSNGGTFSLSVSSDRNELTYSVKSDSVNDGFWNEIPIIIYGDFGDSVTIEYKMKQTVSSSGFASIKWVNDTFETMKSSGWGLIYKTITTETEYSGYYYKGASMKQIAIIIGAVKGNYTINGVIKDVKVNGVPVSFYV